jgi:uncharacterized protein (TIGR02246 family)
MLRPFVMLLIVILLTPAALGQQPAPTSPTIVSEATEARPIEAALPIEDALRRYGAAFNANDAAALAAQWTPQGVYSNKTTGERTAGREALLNDFQELFQESPGVRLMGSLDSVRMIKPDVAAADGQVTAVFPLGETIRTAFSAIYVKEGEQWLLDSIQESELPLPETPYDALAKLEWLVGHWVDQIDGAQVDTVVRWSPSRAFLIRSFSLQLADQEPSEGTQVIGWDPSRKQIRSWSFNSDGSFGEGTWSPNGDEWMVKMTQTQSDGRLASATQVITRVDDNTLTVQTIGRAIDGEPVLATDPVTVVRAETAPAEEPTPAAQPQEPGTAPQAPAATDTPPAATNSPSATKPATAKKQGSQP